MCTFFFIWCLWNAKHHRYHSGTRVLPICMSRSVYMNAPVWFNWCVDSGVYTQGFFSSFFFFTCHSSGLVRLVSLATDSQRWEAKEPSKLHQSPWTVTNKPSTLVKTIPRSWMTDSRWGGKEKRRASIWLNSKRKALTNWKWKLVCFNYNK